jgi:hypothetical protein
MSGQSLSVNLKPPTLEQLEARARETGEPLTCLVERLVEEGWRMAKHPGIVFRGGPTGRRAALIDGADVWEIASVVQAVRERNEPLVETVVKLTGLRPDQVRAIIGYFDEYPAEIESRVRRNHERAKRAETEWRRRRSL